MGNINRLGHSMAESKWGARQGVKVVEIPSWFGQRGLCGQRLVKKIGWDSRFKRHVEIQIWGIDKVRVRIRNIKIIFTLLIWIKLSMKTFEQVDESAYLDISATYLCGLVTQALLS